MVTRFKCCLTAGCASQVMIYLKITSQLVVWKSNILYVNIICTGCVPLPVLNNILLTANDVKMRYLVKLNKPKGVLLSAYSLTQPKGIKGTRIKYCSRIV